jgi:hypothetical protein
MFFLHNRITSMPLKEKICLYKGVFLSFYFILHNKTILLPLKLEKNLTDKGEFFLSFQF